MSEISDDNLKVLIQIKDKLQDVCKNYKFEFTNTENIMDIKTSMMDIIKQSYNGGHITREINKTEMPDECIIFMMQNEGYGITSIDELAEVTQEWSYDHDNKILKLSTRPVFKLLHTRVVLTVNPANDLKHSSENHNPWDGYDALRKTYTKE